MSDELHEIEHTMAINIAEILGGSKMNVRRGEVIFLIPIDLKVIHHKGHRFLVFNI